MRNKLYFLITLFVVFECLLIFSANKFRDIALSNSYDSEIQSINQAYEAGINSARNISDIFLNIVIRNDEILSLFAQAENADEAKRAYIRNTIYDNLKQLYLQEKKLGVKQVHFHLKDSTSFLRMHKPNEFGDSLLGVRYTVETANRTKKYVEGFEEGRIYNGFRFVYPLFYNLQHIGSVEISISADFILNNMNTLDKGVHDFVIRKDVVQGTVFSDERSNYGPSELSESYLRENTSYSLLQNLRGIFPNMEAFFNCYRMMSPKVEPKLPLGVPFGVHTSMGDKEISSVFLPVRNVQGNFIAYFVKTYHDDKYHSINTFYKVAVLSVSVALFFILSFIYMVMSNSHKSKVLNEMLDEKLREHEARLKLKEEMLFQQSKLATLGEMFSALAHQWKQPLNILAMYVQNMLDEEMDEEEEERRNEIVDKCMAQINFMSETINDFMDFIKPSDSVVNKMEMVKAVQDILKLLTPSLEKRKIIVSMKFDHNQSYAKANTNEIKHVLVNIINNAKDAIMDIKEKDKMFTGNIRIEIENSKENNTCNVRISDNGGGIPQELIDRIFDPYITTKQDKEGSGLGLYMAKTIIEKHNGTLAVKNSDKGAVFEISLPSVTL